MEGVCSNNRWNSQRCNCCHRRAQTIPPLHADSLHRGLKISGLNGRTCTPACTRMGFAVSRPTTTATTAHVDRCNASNPSWFRDRHHLNASIEPRVNRECQQPNVVNPYSDGNIRPSQPSRRRDATPVCNGCTIQIDVSDFNPLSIEVEVVQPTNNLVIRASRYVLLIDERNFIRHELLRTFPVSRNVDPASISCSLSPNGILTTYIPDYQRPYCSQTLGASLPYLEWQSPAYRNECRRLTMSNEGHLAHTERPRLAVAAGCADGNRAECNEHRSSHRNVKAICNGTSHEDRSNDTSIEPSETLSTSEPRAPSQDTVCPSGEQNNSTVPASQPAQATYSVQEFLRALPGTRYCKNKNCLEIKVKMPGHDPQGISIKVFANGRLHVISNRPPGQMNRGTQSGRAWVNEIHIPDAILKDRIQSYFTTNECLVIILPLR